MTTTTAIGKSDLVRREFAIREIREESREIDFIASTDAMDSYGEVVAQNWRLERYSSNPVFLWSHKSGDLPIGKSVRTEVRNGRLEFTAKFASAKANPFAEQVFQSYREGNLRGVSVGFYPHTVRVERRNDQDVVVLDDNELYEISATSIPANSEAIAQRIRAACSNTSPPIERGADTKKEEPTMDFEKEAATLKAQVADRDASIASLKTERDSALKSVETLKGELEQRTTERDENAKRAADAETKLIEQEVDGLVGKKIAPAEKDAFVELRRDKPEIFKSLIAQRSDLPVGKSSVLGDDPTPPTDGVSPVASLDDLVEADMKE